MSWVRVPPATQQGNPINLNGLWDFLDYPINCLPDKDSLPLDFKRRAYNYIIDQYFLNQTAQDSILDDGDPEKSIN